MYQVPEKMRLKKFKNVHIPRKSDLFRKYGERVLQPSSIPDEAVINSQPNRKIDTMQAIHNELYRTYAREEAEKARKEAEKLQTTQPTTEE